jgi:hypothetical protein
LPGKGTARALLEIIAHRIADELPRKLLLGRAKNFFQLESNVSFRMSRVGERECSLGKMGERGIDEISTKNMTDTDTMCIGAEIPPTFTMFRFFAVYHSLSQARTEEFFQIDPLPSFGEK